MVPILSYATGTVNMDRSSGGRLRLGLSQKDWPDGGHREEGLRPRRGGRREESITLLKKLWSEDDVSFEPGLFESEIVRMSNLI